MTSKNSSRGISRRTFVAVATTAATTAVAGGKIWAVADMARQQTGERFSAGQRVLIGNYLRGAPCGIAWIIDNSAGFVLDTQGPYVAGIAAPDNSYHAYRFEHGGARILFEWGRTSDNVVGRLSSDKPVGLTLKISSGWPDWTSTFTMTATGADGVAQSTVDRIKWKLRTDPAPTSASSSTVTVGISSDRPVRFTAGLNKLANFDSVDGILEKARNQYEATRPKASGYWGDFIGAITDNMNNSRLYASDNHRLAHCVSRSWSNQANGFPYFCWDSFFTANLAAVADSAVARNTVRAILSYQSAEGLVPNFAHWNGGGASMDRSQPPVATLCVWKMHTRYPDDQKFLAEIYPKLVKWHDWWPQYRNNQHDGLLEWGSSTRVFQNAQYETGWDDNLHFAGAMMRGTTMDAYAIDLSSMWSMDAYYLSLIAEFLGHKSDASRFREDHAMMNRHINEKLWNSDMNCYCSRFWDDVEYTVPVNQSAFGAGFTGEYYRDEKLQTPVASQHVAELNFNWHGSPIVGVPGTHWSARWRGTFTPPRTDSYKFIASADDGVRVFVNGKMAIDDWSVHAARQRAATVRLTQGKAVSVVVEYFQAAGSSQLHFSVEQKGPPPKRGEFLTRLTPMNFYPLICGAPDQDRGQHVMVLLTDPKKFWGRYLLPTLAYDDPDYHRQEYWRGDVWGPSNYIVWQGIKKYASAEQIAEFADRSVELFMKNWITKGICGENYLSTVGTSGHDPHYTWGALLCLIGLESIVDVDDSGQIILNGTHTRNITLNNIPILGGVYDVRTKPGAAELIRDGKVILTAKGQAVRATMP